MSTVTPWGSVGYITYKRTYARRIKNRTEEFNETIQRVIDSAQKQLKCGFTAEEEKELYSLLISLKGSVAGRFLWQMGTTTVDKLGLASLQNCSFTVVDHPIKPFTWAFDMLMLGSGVGYNIQKEYVYELPKAKKAKITRKDTNDADFIVPDSREGWVELLRRVLEAHFVTGESFSYSTVCIRGKGTLIKSFGGTASGPEELCWGMAEISKILNARANKKIRPIDALDMMNIIGAIVVAGNVRRSAQIALGDMDDLQFLSAKRWDLGNIPSWRAMSNNSVICNDINLLPENVWDGYMGNGEPYGLINLGLSQRIGRTGETQYPDPLVRGFNPCAEQSLADKETCCLGELFLPNCETKEEFIKIATYLYKIMKHSLNLPCHQKETEAIVHSQQRMGLGITGYLQATEEQKSWLPSVYEYLRRLDREYSAKMGWPTSVKISTVKPSGTLSLLAGVTPGCHPGIYKFYIRRIRMASDSPLLDKCRQSGYKVEAVLKMDGSEDRNTSVVEFPCRYPESTVLANNMTAVDQLEVVKKLQTEWSDNAVSCTIYYRKEELPLIKEWLKVNYNNNIKTCSFLLHSDHGFKQAPYEEITEEVYNELLLKCLPISGIDINETDVEIDECATGHCPIK
jgi:ribonucleoside-triphosphate reductase